MHEGHIGENYVGRITSGIEPHTLILSAIGFVKESLPVWRDDPERPDVQAEDKLNLQLCKFLNVRARDVFPMVRFDHEEYQVERRSVDLSASLYETSYVGSRLTIYDPILVLECKRLPAPTSDREREYVTGGRDKISGGIQRFKLGFHGAQMELAIMVGYIQERTASEWCNNINKWIFDLASDPDSDDCVWSESERIELQGEDATRGLSNYISSHTRTGATTNEVTIHHLWIVMN